MVICASPHAHDPIHFEKAYFAHSLIDLRNFYCIRCAIWSFKKPLWCAKTIEWLPKILRSRVQTGHMCQPTCPWPPSLREGISCLFLYHFEQFLLHWMWHLKLYKSSFKCKDNRLTSKDLKLQNANWLYVPTHMPMTPFHLEKAYIFLILSSIWIVFVAFIMPSEGLNFFFEFQKHHSNVQRFISLCL